MAPDEKGHADELFQPLDLAAYGAGGNPQFGGRPQQAAMPSHGLENDSRIHGRPAHGGTFRLSFDQPKGRLIRLSARAKPVLFRRVESCRKEQHPAPGVNAGEEGMILEVAIMKIKPD